MNHYERTPAYAAISSELAYQARLFGKTSSGGEPGDGSRSVDEYAAYLQGYQNELIHVVSHSADDRAKLEIVRKIAGLATACMIHNGAPMRVERAK